MTLKAHVELHDREIAAIRKLVLTGMKMLNRNQEHIDRNQEQIDRNQKQINQLREMQEATEEKLQVLIDSLRRGGNGHSRRPIR